VVATKLLKTCQCFSSWPSPTNECPRRTLAFLWDCPLKYGINFSVVEPKLFVSAPAPAQTFKKFPLRLQHRIRLRLKLFGYLFSQLLNDKVDLSWLFVKNIDLFQFLIVFNRNYD
jgi:hypothetical protein